MVMGVLGWIVLGLIAGYIASGVFNKGAQGLPFDILLGIVGAVMGGWIFSAASANGLSRFNVWSLLVAFGGAMVLLALWHAVRRTTQRADAVDAGACTTRPADRPTGETPAIRDARESM